LKSGLKQKGFQASRGGGEEAAIGEKLDLISFKEAPRAGAWGVSKLTRGRGYSTSKRIWDIGWGKQA